MVFSHFQIQLLGAGRRETWSFSRRSDRLGEHYLFAELEWYLLYQRSNWTYRRGAEKAWGALDRHTASQKLLELKK